MRFFCLSTIISDNFVVQRFPPLTHKKKKKSNYVFVPIPSNKKIIHSTLKRQLVHKKIKI